MFDQISFCLFLRQWIFVGVILSLQSVVCSETIGQVANAGDSEVLFPAGLTQNDVLDGWIALLDGESARGWSDGNSKPVEANLSDGQLICDARLSTAMLRTTAQFDDFHLKLEFKTEPGADASVFVRTSPKPKNGRQDCYQIKIANGSTFKEIPQAGVWHVLSVVAAGQRIQLMVDGAEVADSPAAEVGRGYFGLRADAGKAAFRNIIIKPIVDNNLLADKELTRWSTERSEDSSFVVNADGELHVTGGRGQLESKGQFADFILSLQCKTNTAGLNSGIFFRCMPGDFMNGYESQIQNVFEVGDRSKPIDCGTGGIFRRINASRVNADDQAWFAKTIIATGPRIGVWVNGYQVTDWSDTRAAHENPRKGTRLDAGTLMLQGHDPTTNIRFRRIEISPTPERFP